MKQIFTLAFAFTIIIAKAQIKVYSGGNAEVGTTSVTPATKLDVNKSSTSSLSNIQTTISNNAIAVSSAFTSANYLPGIVWYATDNNATKPKAGLWSYADGNGSKLYFGTSNLYSTGITNSALVIDQNGNTGIGTTTPGTQLDIAGNFQINSNLVAGNSYQRFSMGYGAYWNNANSNYTISDPTYNQATFSDENGTFVWTLHSGTLSSPQTYAQWHAYDRMVLTPSGSLGIGTTAPGQKLEVYGASGAYPAKVGSPDGYLQFGPANTSWCHFNTDRASFYFNTAIAVNGGNIGSYSGGNLSLQTSGTTRITALNSNGNVGIGITSPNYLLDVSGGDINVASSDKGYRIQGNKVLWYNTTVTSNIFVGVGAGGSTTATGNTMVGNNAGVTAPAKTNNTCIGYGADLSAATWSGSVAVGANAIVNAGGKGRIGDTGMNSVETQTAWTTVSDGRFKTNVKEDVQGLAFIKKLRPVTYNFDTKAFTEFLVKDMPDSLKTLHTKDMDYTASTNMVQAGLIAQEVEQAENETGFAAKNIVFAPGTADGNYSMNYAGLVVPLIKAVQELSATQDSLLSVIATLKGGQRSIDNGQGKAETILQVELASKDIILYNAEPNPFTNSTTIRYFIPEITAGNAYVGFYDMYGKEIQKLEIKEKGFGKIEANTENLAAGIYSFSIVVDGKVIDTKKMIRNK